MGVTNWACLSFYETSVILPPAERSLQDLPYHRLFLPEIYLGCFCRRSGLPSIFRMAGRVYHCSDTKILRLVSVRICLSALSISLFELLLKTSYLLKKTKHPHFIIIITLLWRSLTFPRNKSIYYLKLIMLINIILGLAYQLVIFRGEKGSNSTFRASHLFA